MISDKMLEAGHTALAGDPQTDSEATFRNVLQAAINAAWTRFDPEDKETWPKNDLIPYSVIHGYGPNCFYWTDGGLNEVWDTVTAYANPRDLMPTWKDET